MPIFNYRVRDKFGLLIKGKIESPTLNEATTSLKSMNYVILNVSPISDIEQYLNDFLKRMKTVGQKEVLSFTRQLASMIHAGLPILTCLNNIIEQTENIKFKKILESIYKDIEGGQSLAKSLERHPKLFPKLFVSMINIGEVSGRLDEVLTRLVFIGKQEAEIKSKITSAMVYPVILLFLSLSVVSFLLIFVLPKFIVVYNSLGVDLPMATKFMLGTSGFLKKFWWLILGVIGLLIYLLLEYRKKEQGRFNVDQFILKIPIVGVLILKYNIARFARTMGSLIKSGISVMQGLAVVENTMSNQVLVTVIKDLRASLLEGHTLSNQLKLSGVFPPMVVQMISAGEQTGKLDDMLLDVADFYDVEVDYEIKNLTTFIEPLMLVFMGGVVLFMALAVLKPIFNLVKVVK